MNVYTMKNTLLALKEPPLSAGGEGAVYEILVSCSALVRTAL